MEDVDAEFRKAAELEPPIEESKDAKKAELRAVPAPIIIDAKSQKLVARDNSELVRMIKIFMNGAALPRTLDTEAKVITAWQAAASLKVPPIVAIQNMAIIHGSLAIWGQLPKALAHATGQVEDFRLIYFDADQKVVCFENKNLTADIWGSVIQIRRSKQSMNEYFFTEVEAKKAGLLGKTGPWQDYRKIMYARRAMGQGIKFEFPDAIMGLNIAEYDFNEMPDAVGFKDVTPSQALADEMNNAYSDEAKAK